MVSARSLNNLKTWKPGQSGNPSGMPKIPDHLRAIASLTPLEVIKVISKYARMNTVELAEVLAKKEASVLELAIASVFTKSIEHGDYQRLSFLLDRAVGKVPVTEQTDEDIEARRELAQLTDGELLRIVREKLPELEKANS